MKKSELILVPLRDYALRRKGDMTEVECVMLAAGRSARMEAWKMTLPWEESTIVEHCVGTALEVCTRVFLVTGYRARELEALFREREDVVLVENHGYEEGMLSSIQKGVRSVGDGEFFLALADMPGVTADIYQDLLNWKNRMVTDTDVEAQAYAVVPKYEGKKGHPVLLSRLMKPRILATDVSKTLRDALMQVPTLTVPVDDPGILQDIDTTSDYDYLLR
jgi:molybdenum cofactor cytidylyltransferase